MTNPATSPSSPPEDANAPPACFNCGAPATHYLHKKDGTVSPLAVCDYHTDIAIAAGVYAGANPTPVASSLDRVSIADETAPVFKFLLGEGSLEGVWFGDITTSKDLGAFWWRVHLRAALSSTPTPIDGEDTENAR